MFDVFTFIYANNCTNLNHADIKMINRYLITNVNFLGSSGMQNFDLTYNISGGGVQPNLVPVLLEQLRLNVTPNFNIMDRFCFSFESCYQY